MRTLQAGSEEMCARCGAEMVAGDSVVDVDSPDRSVYPWSVADWATVHAGCVAKIKEAR